MKQSLQNKFCNVSKYEEDAVLRDNLDENGGGNLSLKRRPVAKA
jgi:hypothetical protein